MESVVERFLRYVSYETTSDEFSETCPSTPKQRLLGEQLVKEMLEMGIEDARIDENGYVYGSIPGDPALPAIGLIAHMDTAPDASGANIKAKIVPFDGSDICLNEEQGIYLRESEYPALALHHGKHLIVTDGTTLLGADDKAGVAEILAAAEYLKTARIKHATLKIAFTPDEEIGRGADKFDIPGFGADYAYTCDGGLIGEMEYETFIRRCHRGLQGSEHPPRLRQGQDGQRPVYRHGVPVPAARRPEARIYRGLRGLPPPDGHGGQRGARPAALHHPGP